MKKLFLTACCFLFLAGLVSGVWVSLARHRQQSNAAPEVTEAGLASGLTIQKLVQQSPLIMTGQCLRTSTAWIDRRIVTLATISVGEAIKGTPASTVNVVLPGGLDANRPIPVGMSYPGAPTIRPREEVFLFLKPSGEMADSYVVSGFAQGKFSIVRTDQGEQAVSPSLNSASAKSDGEVHGNLRIMPLSEFKQKVRSYVK
jgi:hypothetical protein